MCRHPQKAEDFGKYSMRFSVASEMRQGTQNYDKSHPLARAIASAHDTVAEAKRLHSEEQERGGLAHVSRAPILPV